MSPAACIGLYVLGDIYIGVEARTLQGAALTRAGVPLADIVAGESREDAERLFLTRALPRAPIAPPPAPRSGGPAGRASTSIIGLFPEAGS